MTENSRVRRRMSQSERNQRANRPLRFTTRKFLRRDDPTRPARTREDERARENEGSPPEGSPPESDPGLDRYK